MKPVDIKASLIKANCSYVVIANDLGVDPSLVNRVISGKSTSRRVAERISKIIGKPVHQIWPGKYKKSA